MQAGDSLTTGSNNTVIGYDADVSAAGVSDEVTIGNSSVTSLRVPGLTMTVGLKWINNGTHTVANLLNNVCLRGCCRRGKRRPRVQRRHQLADWVR